MSAIDREKILHKIRSLMAKTTGAGCSEQEAMAALDMARAMMDAYEVTEEDLQLTKEEKAVLREDVADQYGIKMYTCGAIAEFCSCKVWISGKAIKFCGLPSDADLATWLLSNLTEFVRGELVKHLVVSIAPKGQRRRIINGFVIGCTSRISARLKELVAKSAAAIVSSNSRALVVVKSQAVSDYMAANNIKLARGRSSSRVMDSGSYHAGKAAGDRASFGRPVGHGSAGLLR